MMLKKQDTKAAVRYRAGVRPTQQTTGGVEGGGRGPGQEPDRNRNRLPEVLKRNKGCDGEIEKLRQWRAKARRGLAGNDDPKKNEMEDGRATQGKRKKKKKKKEKKKLKLEIAETGRRSAVQQPSPAQQRTWRPPEKERNVRVKPNTGRLALPRPTLIQTGMACFGGPHLAFFRRT